MQLYLAGHLAWYDAQKRARFQVNVSSATRLLDLLRDLKIPVAEIAVVVVNGSVVDLGAARVNNSDRVDLFPPVGGGIG